MNCNHCTSDEYAYFAIGNLEGPESDRLRTHLRTNCAFCIAEIKDALEFWYVFAALTERTQVLASSQATPMLRDRVIRIARRPGIRPILGRTTVQTWLRIAAGLLITAGAGTLSWNIGRANIKRDISVVQARIEQQTSTVRKLESENTALRNLVVAARNAPAVFPGKEGIVSVQDPYLLRNLQQARQTQVAVSAALNEERTKVADLERKLSQTTTLLASATHDREEADRQYRKAFDAASLEKARGASQFSTEISNYSTKVQNLESQIGRYRAVIDSQNKRFEQHLQLISFLQSQNLTLVQLRAAGGDQAVSGVALIGSDLRFVLFPANLPPAAAGHTYQLWLIRDKSSAMMSAGTFNGAAKDMPTLQFSGKLPMTGIKSLAITEEPIGGSAAPSGRKIMSGTITKG